MRLLSKWVCPTVYACYSIVLVVLSFIPNISFFRIILNFGMIWLLSVFLYQSTFIRSAFASLVVCMLAVFADVLVTTSLRHFGYSVETLMSAGIQRSLFQITTHIVLFALIDCVSSLFSAEKKKISVKLLILVFPCWFCSALLSLILAGQLLEDKMFSSLYLFILLGMLYMDILFVYQINKLSIQEQKEQERKLAEHHYAMQQAYYNQFRVQQEETRSLWHDISKLLRAAKLEDSNKHLVQVEEMLDSVGSVVDVDNHVVSVILNEYAQEAAHEGIDLSMDVHIPRELSVTAVDLYILLGNTLENAIEACCSLPLEERKIALTLKMHNQILFYKIENAYPLTYMERIRGELHGYGLQNVRRVVEKYRGTIEIHKNDHVFCLIAHLNT